MSRLTKLIMFAVICFALTAIAFGVDFIVRDEFGAFKYECINACGPATVKKSGKCKYLVRSTYFSGFVNACSAEKAALKACGEEKFDKPVREDLRNSACL